MLLILVYFPSGGGVDDVVNNQIISFTTFQRLKSDL